MRFGALALWPKTIDANVISPSRLTRKTTIDNKWFEKARNFYFDPFATYGFFVIIPIYCRNSWAVLYA
jgi:hypothetical protein